jgi:hypothetical protein
MIIVVDDGDGDDGNPPIHPFDGVVWNCLTLGETKSPDHMISIKCYKITNILFQMQFNVIKIMNNNKLHATLFIVKN